MSYFQITPTDLANINNFATDLNHHLTFSSLTDTVTLVMLRDVLNQRTSWGFPLATTAEASERPTTVQQNTISVNFYAFPTNRRRRRDFFSQLTVKILTEIVLHQKEQIFKHELFKTDTGHRLLYSSTPSHWQRSAAGQTRLASSADPHRSPVSDVQDVVQSLKCSSRIVWSVWRAHWWHQTTVG